MNPGIAPARERCPRDSDWCNGNNCASVGFPDCPNRDPIPCAFCHGDGEACAPGNADPHVKVTDWLYPVTCPRCGGTGKDPNA